jgi:hypothetical protein
MLHSHLEVAEDHRPTALTSRRSRSQIPAIVPEQLVADLACAVAGEWCLGD